VTAYVDRVRRLTVNQPSLRVRPRSRFEAAPPGSEPRWERPATPTAGPAFDLGDDIEAFTAATAATAATATRGDELPPNAETPADPAAALAALAEGVVEGSPAAVSPPSFEASPPPPPPPPFPRRAGRWGDAAGVAGARLEVHLLAAESGAHLQADGDDANRTARPARRAAPLTAGEAPERGGRTTTWPPSVVSGAGDATAGAAAPPVGLGQTNRPPTVTAGAVPADAERRFSGRGDQAGGYGRRLSPPADRPEFADLVAQMRAVAAGVEHRGDRRRGVDTRPDEVTVTIGRVEVRVGPPAAAAAGGANRDRGVPGPQPSGLDDYLRARASGRLG
jgi:hypothetical protein